MSNIYESAEILISLLSLGGVDTFPDHSGILDSALHSVIGANSELLDLSFSSTAVGFRCFELSQLLAASIETGMVEWKAGDMTTLQIILPKDQAHEIAFIASSIPRFIEIGSSIALIMNSPAQSPDTRHNVS